MKTPSWFNIVTLIPVLLACFAVTVTFVLGGIPKRGAGATRRERWFMKIRTSLRAFGRPPFALSIPSLVTLVTFLGLAVMSLLNKLPVQQVHVDPTAIFLAVSHPGASSNPVGTIEGIVFAPRLVTPTPTSTVTPTPTSTPTQTSTTEPPTLTPADIPVPDYFVAEAETISPSTVSSPESTRAVNPGPTPTPLPAHRALIPTHCIDNEIALRQGFGFKEPRSHGTFTSFQIVLGDAANYTIRYAREDLVPVSTNITDWPVPWTCEETSNGPRCQRDRPGRNDINSQGTIVVPNISWAKEDATYTFLLQIELRQGGQMREWCAYVYGVR